MISDDLFFVDVTTDGQEAANVILSPSLAILVRLTQLNANKCDLFFDNSIYTSFGNHFGYLFADKV